MKFPAPPTLAVFPAPVSPKTALHYPRIILLFLFGLATLLCRANPLERLDQRWSSARYEACNTAADAKYLTTQEQEVIWILNLMRTDPQLFNQTVVAAYAAEHPERKLANSSYYKSLQRQLATQLPLPLLQPDNTLHPGAVCLAEEQQRSGAMGHLRTAASCKEMRKAQGECCTYGSMTPLEIVMDLLIDEGIEDLGHRKLLLMPFNGISVAMRPHKTYRLSCVIELGI